MSSIIQVTGLSKSYTISHEGKERYTALRDVMARKAKKIFSLPRSLRQRPTTTKEEFWALRDINFEIEQGDRVGIIGRNGAGKSTLLKILSRITEPTSGSIKIKGRVASLLEVGTGFHPELTGRENIFLNGAILGMSRAEIKKHFDAIVDFAEIDQFLDTPVKRYSSGMYVRLAFAVAAHLEPEILVVDEVLAVGDAQFQKKCLGKMEDVSRNDDRTVIFVSHNMAAVRTLCNKGIYLDKGGIAYKGGIEETINSYLNTGFHQSRIAINAVSDGFELSSIEISDNDIPGNFNIEEELVFKIEATAQEDFKMISINLFFNAGEGGVIFATCSPGETVSKGKYTYECRVPANTLNDNAYDIDIMVVYNGEKLLHHLLAVMNIQGNESNAREGSWMGKFPGLIRPTYFNWTRKNAMS